MKINVLLNAILIAGSLVLGFDSAFAIGPEEPACADATEAPCKSTDPEVLAFRKQQINQLYTELPSPMSRPCP